LPASAPIVEEEEEEEDGHEPPSAAASAPESPGTAARDFGLDLAFRSGRPPPPDFSDCDLLWPTSATAALHEIQPRIEKERQAVDAALRHQAECLGKFEQEFGRGLAHQLQQLENQIADLEASIGIYRRAIAQRHEPATPFERVVWQRNVAGLRDFIQRNEPNALSSNVQQAVLVAFVQLLCQLEPDEPALSKWLLAALITINPTHPDVAPVVQGLMLTVGKLFVDKKTHDGRLIFHLARSIPLGLGP
jgi:hypothetical protein